MSKVLVKEISPKNKNILLTGGYGYLGKAITLSLAHHGANVFVGGRSRQKFDEAFPKLKEHEKISFIQLDISSEESIKNAINDLNEQVSVIHGVINNAYYSRGQSPTSMSQEDFMYTLDGSLSSVFCMIKSIIPYMEEGSSIINVGSVYGMVAPDFETYENSPGFINPPHYGAAKAGVIQLTKYYASYLGSKNVRVNCVTPGPFPSDDVQLDKDFMGELSKRTLLKRYGLPEELAGIFTFLMSDASEYITGQNFVVDGGWTIK